MLHLCLPSEGRCQTEATKVEVPTTDKLPLQPTDVFAEKKWDQMRLLRRNIIIMSNKNLGRIKFQAKLL